MSGIENKDKIAVLLAEYNTLRAEEQHRLTVLIQCTTIMVALIGLVVTYPQARGIYVLLGFTLVLYGCVYWLVDLNVFQESKKIRQLERRVNTLANEKLLTWETEYGWGGAWPRSRKALDRIDGLDS
jgi:hypothetical protein